MTPDRICAWAGIAGALIAFLWVLFDQTRQTNDALNHGAGEVSNSDHGEAL